ncbi:hypothetical protein MAR_016782 [Mya arenaria]|uniref:Uncharacterized protein n=1 Tax=Mya arenaria TaxID=6604 RepID=A0ABY7ECC5_MYAAR|nr:hypothetical protein MAR_016782 [Mya arenaria]
MNTIVITQQPAGRQMLIGTVHGHRDWDSGICGCFSYCKSLIMTYCCLACAICNISIRAGECMFYALVCARGSNCTQGPNQDAWRYRGAHLLRLYGNKCNARLFQGSICGDSMAIHVMSVCFKIPSAGSICGDCMAMSCVPLCAICQMQRELEAMDL